MITAVLHSFVTFVSGNNNLSRRKIKYAYDITIFPRNHHFSIHKYPWWM